MAAPSGERPGPSSRHRAEGPPGGVPTDTPHRFTYPPTLCWPGLRVHGLPRPMFPHPGALWLGTDTNPRAGAPPPYPAAHRPPCSPGARPAYLSTPAAYPAYGDHHGLQRTGRPPAPAVPFPPGRLPGAPGRPVAAPPQGPPSRTLTRQGRRPSAGRDSANGHQKNRRTTTPKVVAIHCVLSTGRTRPPLQGPAPGGSDDGGELYLNKSS